MVYVKKLSYLLLIIFFTCSANGQLKKISTLTLNTFSKYNQDILRFEARNDAFYFSVKNKIYTVNKIGEVKDSFKTFFEDTMPCSITNFDVKKDDTTGKDVFYCFTTYYITMYRDGKEIKKIFVDSTHGDFTHMYIDDKKNVFVIYYGKLHELKDFGKQQITEIDANDKEFSPKDINIQLFKENSFLIHDSIAVFTKWTWGEEKLIITNTRNYERIKIISFSKQLNIPKSHDYKLRAIWFDGINCLFVASIYKDRKDVVAMTNIKTGRITQLTQYSLPPFKASVFVKKNIVKPKDEEENDFLYFLYRNYPNGYRYSVDAGKLFVFYNENGLANIDTYSLPF